MSVYHTQQIAAATKQAEAADAAFEAAIRAAGYKSRWDWSQLTDRRPLTAYRAKVAADEAMHAAWEESRGRECRP